MKFSDIPGHDDVKEKLRAMVDNNRMPHALLLEGPPGAGKFALARALAQYIHCQNRTADGNACGRCPACQQHQDFNHIDTAFSFPVVKKTSSKPAISDDFLTEFRQFISEYPFMNYEEWLALLDNINAQPVIYVDEASELLRKLSYTCHNSKYKIVLMWLPEKMKQETANKLLKLIEEPSDDTIFILTSDNSRQILPTIYSRCQRVLVNRYRDEEIAKYLTDNYAISASDAMQISRLACGSITQALNLISVSKERTLYLDLFKELMRKAYLRDVGALKVWASDLAALGREREMKFWDYCARMMRENFILNLKTGELNVLNSEELQFSEKFSPFINERNVLKLFDVVNAARADIAANVNAKIVNFDVAVKVILLLKQ